MSSLRAQTIWSMLPILITSVVSIVSVPIYFRVLGDEMYAMWFYVGTMTGAFGFMDLGMGVAVGRYMGVALGAGDQVAAREYWSTGNAIVFPLVAFFALVFAFGGAMWAPVWFKVAESQTATLQWAMVAGGFGLFFSYYGQMWFVLAATYLDFRFVSVLRSTLSLVSTLGSVAVALVTRNAAWLVAFATLVSAAQFYVLMRRGNRLYELPVRFKDFKTSRLVEMLPYTLKTFGQLLAGSLLGSLDRVLLGRLAPAADFAAYNVSLNVGSRVQSLSQAAMGPIFCNATRGVGGDAARAPKAIYRDSFDFLFPWYGAFLMWLIVWETPLLKLWLGANAAMVELSFSWIVAGCCIAALGNLSSAQLGPIDRVGTGLLFSIAVSMLSGALVVGGWWFGGLGGAAAGFFAARLVLVLQDGLVRRFIGVSYGRAELLGLGCLVAAALICGVSRFALVWLGSGIVSMLTLAFLSGAASVALVIIFNVRWQRPHA